MIVSMAALALGMAQAAECVPAPAANHAGASALIWYISATPVALDGKVYNKYGLPRVLHKDEVELFRPYKGGFFYVEKGSTEREVVYLLTRIDGCEFQPYAVQ
jgi:hypothetical protein